MAVSLVGRTATGGSAMINSGETPTRLLELALPAVRDPGHLGREALNMALLLLKIVARDEQGIVAVPHADRLDLLIEIVADLLPASR